MKMKPLKLLFTAHVTSLYFVSRKAFHSIRDTMPLIHDARETRPGKEMQQK